MPIVFLETCIGNHQLEESARTKDFLVELLTRYSKNGSARSIVSARTLDRLCRCLTFIPGRISHLWWKSYSERYRKYLLEICSL